MSKLLLDSNPLVVIPELAVKFGLNESIVLQQVHYWLQKSTFVINEKKWVYKTIKEWRLEFPFWSADTIKRTFKTLEKNKIIMIGNFNKKGFDKTKWYSIDYHTLSAIESKNEDVANPHEQSLVQIAPWSSANCPMHESKMHQPIPETPTETPTDILNYIADDVSESDFVEEFLDLTLSEKENLKEDNISDEQKNSSRGENELKKIKTTEWSQGEKQEKPDLFLIQLYQELYTAPNAPNDIKSLKPFINWGRDRKQARDCLKVYSIEVQEQILKFAFEIQRYVQPDSFMLKKLKQHNWALSVIFSADSQQALKKGVDMIRSKSSSSDPPVDDPPSQQHFYADHIRSIAQKMNMNVQVSEYELLRARAEDGDVRAKNILKNKP